MAMIDPSFRKVRLGDFFENRKDFSEADLPVLSVTIADGVVRRETLEHTIRTTLEQDEHLLVRKGDIVYNMMRMWQGASGIAKEDGVASPAYVVCTPLQGIDPVYADFLFHTPRMIYLFWAYSHGLTDDRRRLYFADFVRVPTQLPPISEQRGIAEILSKWDLAIGQTATLIDVKTQLKQGLMQQMLSGRRKFKTSTSSWDTFRIGDLLSEVRRYVSVEDNSKYRLVSVRRNSGGLFDREPRLGQAIGYSKLMKLETGDFLIARRQVLHGAMTTVPKRFNGAFVSNAYATLVPKAGNRLHMPFFDVLSQTPMMYHKALRCSYGVTIEKMVFNLDWFLRETISIPTAIEEQERVANLFTTLNTEIRRLQRQLDYLKRQKSGLMQHLLTGKMRLPVSLLKNGAK